MLDELCPVCKGIEVTTGQTEPGETGIVADNITASWTDVSKLLFSSCKVHRIYITFQLSLFSITKSRSLYYYIFQDPEKPTLRGMSFSVKQV